MQMIRRYARILREQQARNGGPRIGAKERRLAKEAAHAVVSAVKTPEKPAV
jgi:hypothetical protein